MFDLGKFFIPVKPTNKGVLVADDLNKLLLGLLRCFVQKTVGYCKRSYQLTSRSFVKGEKFGVWNNLMSSSEKLQTDLQLLNCRRLLLKSLIKKTFFHDSLYNFWRGGRPWINSVKIINITIRVSVNASNNNIFLLVIITLIKVDRILWHLYNLRSFWILYECFLLMWKRAFTALDSVGVCLTVKISRFMLVENNKSLKCMS